ncbi:hypothetical protein Tco_0256820 [Tanacetum coccineum]
MHVYTSILTTKELKEAITEYCIPTDLHPRLPPPDLTMNKLLSKYIRIYIEQLEQGGLRVPFYTFFLAVIKHFGVHVSQLVPMGMNKDHWFSFENKTGGRSKKCFKEVTSSLKGWKKKFFLIDRCAIPWRHTYTDLHDDFPTHYNEDDASCFAEFVIPLRPPPRHLLYVCGLTMACRHPELAYKIKDQDGNVLTMDTFLKLPVWIGTVMSKDDPIPDDQQKLAKAQAKHAEEGGSAAPHKKRKVCKNQEPDRSGSEGTLFPTPLHCVGPTNEEEPITIVLNDTTGNDNNVEREIVDLSGNTRVTTSSVTINWPSPHPEHHDTHEHMDFDAYSFNSTHHEDTEEDTVDRRSCQTKDFVMICVFAHSELAKSWFLIWPLLLKMSFWVAYQMSRCDAHLAELDRLRTDLQRAMQANDGLLKKFTLLGTVRSGCLDRRLEPQSTQLADAEGRVKVLDGEKATLVTEFAQAEVDHHKLVREFVPTVVRKLQTSVEYRKSLATLVSLCLIAVDALMQISPDVPPLSTKDKVGPSEADDTDAAA